MIAFIGKALSLGFTGILALAFFWFVSACFWSWIIMLVAGAVAPGWGWGFWDAFVPWGITAPLVLG